MAYTYQSFVVAITAATMGQRSDPDFLLMIPSIIDEAEQRVYRDLDLLSSTVVDSTASLTANSRSFTLPTSAGRFVTVKEFSIFTGTYPSGRIQLLPQAIELLNFLYPSETGTNNVPPVYYAPITDQNFLVGPSPYSPYNVEIRGTIRPTPLSSANTTTFLTQYTSDLFFSSAMLAAMTLLPAVAQKNINYVEDYKSRLASLNIEETKRKFSFGDWVQKQ